jgi:hypothetical protein
MASKTISPFVLQKIRERREADEEREEDEAEEEAEDEVEAEDAAPAEEKAETKGREALALGRSGKIEPRSHRGGSLTARVQKFFKKLGPTETALLLGGGALLLQHVAVPRGTSILSRMLAAIAPAPRGRVTRSYAGQDDYAGANLQAGWNRGAMPYGGWSHASPGGPWPYAHGGPEHRWW